MATLFRWTTPSFDVEFDETVDVAEIDKAYLVIKQWDSTVVSKDIASAVVDTDTNTISWTLSQAETGAIVKGKRCEVQCDCVFSSGARTTTDPISYTIQNSGVDEVIS